MMSRKFLITSVLLVLGYCFVYYAGEVQREKNVALKMIMKDVLRSEKDDFYNLKSAAIQASKKHDSLYLITDELVKEAEMIIKSIAKYEFRNTSYMEGLYSNFDIDHRFMSSASDDIFFQQTIYKSLNKYLSDHYARIDSGPIDYANTKLRVMNQKPIYEIDQVHRFNFQFYENFINSNLGTYSYTIDGKEKIIDELPLVLDYLPNEIKFNTTITDEVTGERRKYKSTFTP